MKNNLKEQSKTMWIVEFVNTFMPGLKLNPYQKIILENYKPPIFWVWITDIIQDKYTKYKKSNWYKCTTIIIDDPIFIPDDI